MAVEAGAAMIMRAIHSRRVQRTRVYGLGLLTGILSGLIAVAYRALAARLDSLRLAAFSPGMPLASPRILAWAATVIVAGVLTAFMVAKAPMIRGSGIPQVKASLMR